jgi:lysophospholipase L1-like esterase
LRQIVQLSLGGERLRIRFSNEFGDAPLTLRRAHLARNTGGGSVDPASDTPLSFGGSASVTIPVGASVTSDEVVQAVPAFAELAITLAFDGAPPTALTGHPGSRTTSYLQVGDAVSAARLNAAQETEHWYFISEIDVLTDGRARAIVTLGDSITDGRGSTTNGNDRWPNLLSRRLAGDPRTALIAVLNQGAGGNRVIEQGLGVHALGRFERDVLGPPGVRWVVIFEGINDFGASPPVTGDALIQAFRRMTALAHARDIRVIGGTILPFEGAAYYTAAGEAGRQSFNEWLRHSGELDAVIDFDAVGRHPQQPRRLSPLVDGGDALHPCAAGYQILADAIDLSLFCG